MSSKPTNRDSLIEREFFVPPPAGCMNCYTREENRKSSCGCCPVKEGCEHTAHFNAIKAEFTRRGYLHLGSGSFRSTWTKSRNSKFVYKIPLSHDGYCDNFFEALAWQEREFLYCRNKYGPVPYGPIGHRVARCSMLPSGVLVMERMKNADHYGHQMEAAVGQDPTLVDDKAQHLIQSIDNCQAGIDTDGRLRLYDFTHRTEIALGSSFSSLEAL